MEPATQTGFSFLEETVLAKLRAKVPVPVRLKLWNGTEVALGPGEPIATVQLEDRAALRALLLDPETNFGDLYREKRLEVQGNLPEVLAEAYRTSEKRRGWYARLISAWLNWRYAGTEQGSRSNIHHHYDIGTDFYRLWLDESLNYTCAYFPSAGASLEEAQAAKMDLVCRKLRLKPGETVAEAGCGWGALARHMARNCGVRVRSFNISHEQIRYARERAKQEGFGSAIEYIEDDYRNISGNYDVFVSIGMLEHVGRDHYEELAQVMERTIGTGGRGLLHFIGRNRPLPLNNWIRKRIFPGAYPPTLQDVMPIFETNDYTVMDVENLRWHYARTLEHWLERYERSEAQVQKMFDESFVRSWRLYLAGSLAAFRAGSMQLFQILFAGAACKALPWTREDIYAQEEPEWSRAVS